MGLQCHDLAAPAKPSPVRAGQGPCGSFTPLIRSTPPRRRGVLPQSTLGLSHSRATLPRIARHSGSSFPQVFDDLRDPVHSRTRKAKARRCRSRYRGSTAWKQAKLGVLTRSGWVDCYVVSFGECNSARYLGCQNASFGVILVRELEVRAPCPFFFPAELRRRRRKGVSNKLDSTHPLHPMIVACLSRFPQAPILSARPTTVTRCRQDPRRAGVSSGQASLPNRQERRWCRSKPPAEALLLPLQPATDIFARPFESSYQRGVDDGTSLIGEAADFAYLCMRTTSILAPTRPPTNARPLFLHDRGHRSTRRRSISLV